LVPKVPPAIPVPLHLGSLDHREHKGSQGTRDLKVYKEFKVFKEFKEIKVFKVFKEIKVLRVPSVLRALPATLATPVLLFLVPPAPLGQKEIWDPLGLKEYKVWRDQPDHRDLLAGNLV
jgi:hypothetical protein